MEIKCEERQAAICYGHDYFRYGRTRIEVYSLLGGFCSFREGIDRHTVSFGASCLKTIISQKGIKKNLVLLCLSGIALGINWITMFEAFRHTSVAVATICYYMAPVIVILVSLYLQKRLP